MSETDSLLDTLQVPAGMAGEARKRQEILGGTLESHLLRLGAVTEQDLCDNLQSRYGGEAVCLRGREIPVSILNFIPREIARERCLLPIAWQPNTGCLTVACTDPTEVGLADDLKRFTGVGEIQLVAAVESILRCRIVDAYRNAPSESAPDVELRPVSCPAARATILLVGPIDPAGELFARALAEESCRVMMVDSLDEALAEIDHEVLTSLIIRDRRRERHALLLDRLRRVSPRCIVRFVENIAGLALTEPLEDEITDLFSAHLQLTLSLANADAEAPSDGAGEYSRLVLRLCHRLHLPKADRLMVLHAACLRELATTLMGSDAIPNWEQFGQSDDNRAPWPPVMLAMLSRAESDVDDIYPDRLPLAVLGGNILRLAAYVLRRIDRNEPMTFDRYEGIREELRRSQGKAFLPELIDALTALLIEDVSLEQTAQTAAANVLLFNAQGDDTLMLGPCLEHLGFHPLSAHNEAAFLTLYERHWPEFLVVLAPGPTGHAEQTVKALTELGIAVRDVPTFVLADAATVPDLTHLLKEGIEDVIPLDGDLDLLLVKLTRLRTRFEAEHSRRLRLLQEAGTHGSLADMNVIDLLQAMGHTEKTIRISITAVGSQLTMFLDEGRLIFAECDEKTGPDAVYCALAWSQGIWSVDPISPDELPSPNNDLTIDSILIEGCHRLDESQRILFPQPDASLDDLLS